MGVRQGGVLSAWLAPEMNKVGCTRPLLALREWPSAGAILALLRAGMRAASAAPLAPFPVLQMTPPPSFCLPHGANTANGAPPAGLLHRCCSHVQPRAQPELAAADRGPGIQALEGHELRGPSWRGVGLGPAELHTLQVRAGAACLEGGMEGARMLDTLCAKWRCAGVGPAERRPLQVRRGRRAGLHLLCGGGAWMGERAACAP